MNSGKFYFRLKGQATSPVKKLSLKNLKALHNLRGQPLMDKLLENTDWATLSLDLAKNCNQFCAASQKPKLQ